MFFNPRKLYLMQHYGIWETTKLYLRFLLRSDFILLWVISTGQWAIASMDENPWFQLSRSAKQSWPVIALVIRGFTESVILFVGGVEWYRSCRVGRAVGPSIVIRKKLVILLHNCSLLLERPKLNIRKHKFS